MAATLEEIIVGTCIKIEYFEQTQEGHVSPMMFEDPTLAEIYKAFSKAYKEGNYDKDYGLFNLWDLFNNDFPTMLRAVSVSIGGCFPDLKWEYNRECWFTGRGNWTDLEFPDYVKSFVNNYVERCKAEENRTN